MGHVPTARELSAPYANFMLNPLPAGTVNVCAVCLTFTTQGFPTCWQCGHHPRHADLVVPISYSVDGGQLHDALRGYKRDDGRAARQLQLQLAAVLWRFLRQHEHCIADRLGIERLALVTTVPSSSAERDEHHPLQRIVGKIVGDTRDRYERLLVRSTTDIEPRTVNPAKYAAVRPLDGEAVLLIEDTWVSGGNAESAAGSLKEAGAGQVAVVAIGRHVHASDGNNAARLKALPRRYDWDRCPLE
jgi:predicted amidophosphoribosyltransferase